MSSPAANRVSCAPASQQVFPDEILEEILLRLDAAEDLARTSAACTTFHRVVSARRFLHRFRCLHPPPVLGVLECFTTEAFHPAEPPHRSAPAARALAQAADFTFAFLGTPHPDPHPWMVCDARDSRVLLYRYTSSNATFADVMVCDPLHRRHVQLPPIPDDLAAANGVQALQDFFLDPDTNKDTEKQDFSFRVICTMHCQYKLVTFHFSSVTGQWLGITLNRTVPLDYTLVRFQEMFERYYAHGCYFWIIAVDSSFMIMLNRHDMKLSVVDLPPGMDDNSRARAIVEAGEGTIGLFALSDGMLHLYYKSLQGTDWQHKRIIPLPKPNSHWSIIHAATGHLLLKASPPNDASPFAVWQSQYFTLNLKTFLVERLCVSNRYITDARLYASFPSPFSLPSI